MVVPAAGMSCPVCPCTVLLKPRVHASRFRQDTATLTGHEALAAVLRRRCAAALPGAAPPPYAPDLVPAVNQASAACGAEPPEALGAAPAPFAAELGLADVALTGLALSQAARHREFAEQARPCASLVHRMPGRVKALYILIPLFPGEQNKS